MKAPEIQLGDGTAIPILYEDRSVLAIDKPAGWLVVPTTWQRTQRNLQTAIMSSIAARDFWARSRNLKFLRYVHRLDAETSGVMLFGKTPGAVRSYGDLFESRRMEKVYLAVIQGVPRSAEWSCFEPLAEESSSPKRMKIDLRKGKEATTHFRLLAQSHGRSLVEARPLTGRTHQIRVHLAHTAGPVVGDPLYGETIKGESLALRSCLLAYGDPFTRRHVVIKAPVDEFLRTYKFTADEIIWHGTRTDTSRPVRGKDFRN
ncbi:MAG: RluA family pseudouridine synthase [Verrucomicrobia subdivision 3 bacterium]|nr:RluA family pseudouridine synthase [Limisphaerales bacterium]